MPGARARRGPPGRVFLPRALAEGTERLIQVAKPKEDDGLSEAARAERGAAPYLEAVWRMVAALVLGAVAGFWADRKLGLAPWGVVSGLGLGLALGFWSLMRSLSKLEKRR
jgi:F0F1-type ATP synthase assembly protein I